MVKRGFINKLKEFWKKRPFLFMLTIVVIILFVIIFGAKITLYLNYLLGNDTLLQLSSDKKELFLNKGQDEKVNFRAEITANPFCSVKCKYKFEDISKNNIIDEDSFTLKVISPITKQYKIEEENIGTGIELYRFSMECESRKNFLCQTKQEKTKRNILITISYNLTEQDKNDLEDLRLELNNFSSNIFLMKKEAITYNNSLLYLENLIIFNISFNETKKIIEKINHRENELEKVYNNWENQEYGKVKEDYDLLKTNLNNTDKEFDILKNELNIPRYNNIVYVLENVSDKLQLLTKLNINETFSSELNRLILDFNSNLSEIYKKDYIENKEKIAYNIKNKTYIFEEKIIEEEIFINFQFYNISELNITAIYFNKNLTTNNLIFGEVFPKCCIFGECLRCCVEENCTNSKKNYPIIFLHGHSFNKDLAIEFSLEEFNNIKENLEKEGYLDAGFVSINDEIKNSWGKIPIPLLIKSSYYYDVLKKEDNYIAIPSKNENIDSYAIRLKEIVKFVEKETDRPKVIIIAHSMGGLVVRRYIQIFGDEDVEKIILIGTPNLGIEGNVADYCSIIGEASECKDMIKDSLFMNKLNIEKQRLPIYNIVGQGCKMQGEIGDGVVLKKNAIIEGVNNYFINGTCKDAGNLLHLQMLNPELYPEVYQIIKKSLKD